MRIGGVSRPSDSCWLLVALTDFTRSVAAAGKMRPIPHAPVRTDDSRSAEDPPCDGPGHHRRYQAARPVGDREIAMTTTMTVPLAGIAGMIGRKRLARTRPCATPGTGEDRVAAVSGHHPSLTPSRAGSGTFHCNLCHLRRPQSARSPKNSCSMHVGGVSGTPRVSGTQYEIAVAQASMRTAIMSFVLCPRNLCPRNFAINDSSARADTLLARPLPRRNRNDPPNPRRAGNHHSPTVHCASAWLDAMMPRGG